MPRNVRNFWIDATIDGRESRMSGGPRAKDGGMFVAMRMRNRGEVTTPLYVAGTAMPDGDMLLRVDLRGGAGWTVEKENDVVVGLRFHATR